MVKENKKSGGKTKAQRSASLGEALAVHSACLAILGANLRTGKNFGWAVICNRDVLEPVVRRYVEQRMRILKQYAKLDDAGNVVPDEKNNAQFEPKENADKFHAELAELLNMDAGIEFYKVPFSSVPDDIEAGTLAQLEPILTDLPAR